MQLMDGDLLVVHRAVKMIEVVRQSDAESSFDGHSQYIVERFRIVQLLVLDRPGPGGILEGRFSIAKDEREQLHDGICVGYRIVEGPTISRDSRLSLPRIGSTLRGKIIETNLPRVPLFHFEEEGNVTGEEVVLPRSEHLAKSLRSSPS